MDREPKCWPEKAQLGGCFKESCQRRGREAIWRGTMSDSFARKKAREVSQHLHRTAGVARLLWSHLSRQQKLNVMSMILCEQYVFVSRILLLVLLCRICIGSFWNVKVHGKHLGKPVLIFRLVGRILETMEPPSKYMLVDESAKM